MVVRTSDNEALLARSLQDLRVKWESTAALWHDKARDDFERKHLEELIQAAQAARHAMKAVDALLRDAISECS